MRIKTTVLFALFPLAFACFALGQGSQWSWQTCAYPEFHFSIQSPAALERTDMKNPEILFVSTHRNLKPKFIMVVIACPLTEAPFRYDPTHPVSLADIPKRMMGVFTQLKTMTGFISKTVDFPFNGAKAVLTKGTCKDNGGVVRSFAMMNVKKRSYFWSITLQYQNGDSAMEKIAEHAMTSFKFL